MKELFCSLSILSILILLSFSGCDSRDQEKKTLTKHSDDTVTVHSGKVDKLPSFSVLRDSITMKGSGDSISIQILDLIDIINSQTKYMFVLQSDRVERVVTKVRNGRVPLKDLLYQIEVATKSTISVSGRNLIIIPNDLGERF